MSESRERSKLKADANNMRAAQPTRNIFDPWNSSSTGHQRAENRLGGSTSWRINRTAKLQEQLRDAEGRGGKRMQNCVVGGGLVATGTVLDDMHCSAALGARAKGQQTLVEALDRSRAKRRRTVSSGEEAKENNESDAEHSGGLDQEHLDQQAEQQESTQREMKKVAAVPREKQLFRNLTFYINGSTYPIISDHKLKRILIAHGGRLSLALGRRTVTHVVLGVQSHQHENVKRVAGGGLAGGKIQKEIKTTKASSVRYVSVEWVLACLERGTRVSEAAYAPGVAVAGRGQQSVLGIA